MRKHRVQNFKHTIFETNVYRYNLQLSHLSWPLRHSWQVQSSMSVLSSTIRVILWYGSDWKTCWKRIWPAKIDPLADARRHLLLCGPSFPWSQHNLALSFSVWQPFLSFCPWLSLTHSSSILMIVYFLRLTCLLLACQFFLLINWNVV